MTRLHLPPQLLTGDLDEQTTESVADYLHDVVETRGFPCHLNVLFNALYFALDTDVGGHRYDLSFNPLEHITHIAHDSAGAAVPVGAFVEVAHAGTKTIAGEIVAKEGAHPHVVTPGPLSGPPVQLVGNPTIDGAVPERLIVDFAAFADLTTDDDTLRRARDSRSWTDEYGHLHYTATYPAGIDEIDHFVDWLLANRNHDTLLAWAFDQPPDSEMLDAALRQTMRSIRDVVDVHPDLRMWGNYVVGPTLWKTHTRHNRDVRFDLSHLGQLRNELTWIAGEGPTYHATGPALRRQLDRDQLTGTSYLSVQVIGNAWVAQDLNNDPGRIHTRPNVCVHARLDDRFQAGGLWRVDSGDPPPPWADIDVDVELGIGGTPPDDLEELAPDDQPIEEPPAEDPDAPEPEPAELHAPDEASWRFAIRPGAVDRGLLPIPSNVRGRLEVGQPIKVIYHHDVTPPGLLDGLGAADRSHDTVMEHQAVYDADAVLTDLQWPLWLPPATLLLCYLNGSTLYVRDRRISPSEQVGEIRYDHEFDIGIARQVAGLPPLVDVGRRPTARSHSLADLIAVAFAANPGTPHPSGRLLTWPELTSAVFGERLAHDRTTQQRVARACRRMGLPRLAGRGAIWPDDRPAGQTADRDAYRSGTHSRMAQSVSHASATTVRMHLRYVGEGSVSKEKRDTYQRALQEHGADSYLPPDLPAGYTWVPSHDRSGW